MAEKIDLGPIQKLMDDPSISEIMINGAKLVFAERNGKKMPTDVTFQDDEEIFGLVQKIYSRAGKRIDQDVPYADVCLPDGTRVNAIIPPLSRTGISVTFRKFSKDIKTIDDLIKLGSLTPKAADLLVACIKGRINMIFSGGTGVGKTTLLQILSNYFTPEERVVVVEDSAELQFPKEKNIVCLEARTPDEDSKGEVSIRDLIRNSLRMAPDRLVIGEVRGGEAIDMLQAMATGHAGTIGVVHGNSPKDVIARLETMVLMSGVQLPLGEARKLIVSTINLIVHMQRLQDGSRKVTYVTEIRGIEREEILFNDLFTFHFDRISEDGRVLGKLKSAIKYYPLFFHKFQKEGLLTSNVFAGD